MATLSAKYEDEPEIIGLYFNYVNAAIDFYAAVCANRHMEVCNIVRDRIGANLKTLLLLCDSDHKEEIKIISYIKGSFLNLAKVLCLEMNPFVEWST